MIALPISPTDPPTLPAQVPRFTIDGEPNLESRLARTCNEVLDGVRRVIPRSRFQGLLLGGGYGRGEGGVCKTETGERPYNDLEFYVFVRGNRFLRFFDRSLEELSRSLTRRAGIEVEFKTLSLEELRNARPSMFYYDLGMGHRWLWGDDRLLAGCDHHRQPWLIPPSEATRLLLNRCTGLLLARERLSKSPFVAEDADFVGRNLAKAQLAYGDAVLTLRGQYHWSCRERERRLTALAPLEDWPWLTTVRNHHTEGLEFKLHPSQTRAPVRDLQAHLDALIDLGRIVWLWIESRRLGRPFESAWSYALSGLNKCPETNPGRNRLVNMHALGLAAGLSPGASRHPRERLFHALALMLWEPSQTQSFPQLRKELKTRAQTQAGLIQAYLSLWRKVR